MWVEWLATAAFSTALLATFVFTGATTRLDNAIYDMALKVRRSEPSKDIVIVSVDAASLNEKGEWPWPRRMLADLIDEIGHGKPRGLGWYFLFAAASNPADDQAVHNAMAHTPTYLGQMVNGDYKVGARRILATSAAAGEGAVDSDGDDDGIVRRAFLFEGRGIARPRLALVLARLEDRGPVHLRVSEGRGGAQGIVRGNEMLIPFVGPPGSFRHVSAAAVLDGKVSPEVFKDKFVLFGASSLNLLDNYPTPVSGRSGMPNVEVDANILNALLTGTAITPASPVTVLIVSLAMMWLVLIALVRLGPTDNLVVAAGMAALPAIGAVVAVVAFRVWLPPASFLVTEAMIVPYWGWRRLNAASGYLAEELRALERSVGGAVLARAASAPAPGGDLVLQQMTLLQEAKTRVSDLRRFVADILANFPDPVLVVDRQGHILTVNQAAADFADQAGLSTTPHSPVQPILARIAPVTPNGGSAWPPPERDAANARPFSGMGMGGRAYEVRFTPTRSAGDEQTGWIIHLADVTSLVSAMRQREEALQLLSHDMRSPQSAILATLSHPEFKGTPPALRQRIEGHARRTLELADAFVRLAKAESARYVLEPIDLAHVTQDAADAVWGLSQAAGVKVEVQVANEDDEYVILADRGLLTRALVNLLDNAVKFSPAGEKVICSIGHATLEGAPAIECRIADHAGGMSRENAGSLFNKFASFRDGAHAPTGIGLGLALVHTVITRHNGDIAVETVEGEGSVFILKLPRHDEEADPESEQPSAAELAAAE
ncbi:MAG TPA: CHASE2 domain-containing protein [Caulobacteraceae bacterium]|jgi:CHASE2 domain-containing sensor protein/signal transduction histidine kinase